MRENGHRLGVAASLAGKAQARAVEAEDVIAASIHEAIANRPALDDGHIE